MWAETRTLHRRAMVMLERAAVAGGGGQGKTTNAHYTYSDNFYAHFRYYQKTF